MSIRTVAYDDIEPGHERESARGFQQLGVLEQARRRPGLPGGELSRATDRAWLFALTTLWESTAPARAWQAQQLLPAARMHPDLVGLGQPGTADILEVVQPGPASAQATCGNGRAVAKPALMCRTAAWWTAIKPNRSGSRCCS
jgi:heme-degrading monooxygenase HmoA